MGASSDVSGATVFSGIPFCRVWAETFGLGWEPVGGEDRLGVLYSRSRRLGLRSYALGPRGLYWGASDLAGDAGKPLVDLAADQCRGVRTVSVTWNFRHDARAQLERARAALGPRRCSITESRTHVLAIEGLSLAEILSKSVKGVTRRQARHALDAGVEVRPLSEAAEFDQHDALYTAWTEKRAIPAHPAELFRRLASELGDAARMLGAFEAGELVAAILVFCDAREWFYWHAVRDARRDRHFAMDALLAWAVDRACRAGAQSFNFGASNDIRSLESFKERWGAAPRPVWSLRWNAPLWSPVVSTLRRVRGGGQERLHAA